MAKKNNKPVTLVIFGATGNLAINKIFPAVISLFRKNGLPRGSRVLGVSRREWSDDAFRGFLKESFGGDDFLDNFFHSEVEFEEGRGYYDLKEKLIKLDKELGKTEWVFYLSLAPKFYECVACDMNKAKLFVKGSKLLVEKPFGTNEKTARSLNKTLLSFLKHGQIYRVDHYLGKETIRTIMRIHETSPWLAKLLTKESVESIRLRLFEEKGIEKRGNSYDSVGAFRDVGQNHLLETFAGLCMVPPKSKNATSFHDARAKVLEAIMPPAKTCELSRRGQYEDYIKEWAIKDSSQTETAFEIITSLSSGKLAGVPITLEAGKKMSCSEAFVEVLFKNDVVLAKKIIFRIQPDSSIKLVYNDRTEEIAVSGKNDAYENVIRDAVSGERRHFVGSREIIASWKYSDRVVACWDKVPLEIYSSKNPFLKSTK